MRLTARLRRRRARGRLRLAGISVVRDESDVVALSVLHHLSLGLDHVLVLDNGSSDGTDRILAALARRAPVRWTRDDSAYRQVELRSGLAREAVARGADWILPFDADEFWLPTAGRLRDLLRDSSGTIGGDVRNFVQRRQERLSSPRSLLTMTRRVAEPVGPFERTRELVESGAVAYAEMLYPPKVVARASAEIEIGPGSHNVSGADETIVLEPTLLCLHAPLRSEATLRAKAARASRLDAGEPADLSWHLRRWGRIQAEEGLHAEWHANSYDAAGALDVFGRRAELVHDPTLADLVRGHLRACP